MESITSVLSLPPEAQEEFTFYVNMACTLDSIVATQGHPIEISDEQDWSLVHGLRSQSIAIIVGSTTILTDDPSLLVKTKFVKNPNHPIRIVLDRRGRLTGRERVFKDQDKARTLWFTSKRLRLTKEPKYHVVKVKESIETSDLIELIEQILREDYKISSGFVMVEGGPQVVKSFLETGKIKRFRLFRSNLVAEMGVPILPMRPRSQLIPLRARVMKSGFEELYDVQPDF